MQNCQGRCSITPLSKSLLKRSVRDLIGRGRWGCKLKAESYRRGAFSSFLFFWGGSIGFYFLGKWDSAYRKHFGITKGYANVRWYSYCYYCYLREAMKTLSRMKSQSLCLGGGMVSRVWGGCRGMKTKRERRVVEFVSLGNLWGEIEKERETCLWFLAYSFTSCITIYLILLCSWAPISFHLLDIFIKETLYHSYKWQTPSLPKWKKPHKQIQWKPVLLDSSWMPLPSGPGKLSWLFSRAPSGLYSNGASSGSLSSPTSSPSLISFMAF